MKVMALADREAAGLNHDRVGTGELLVALLTWFEDGGRPQIQAQSDGANFAMPLKADDARAEVRRITGSGAGVRTSAYSFTPSAEKLLLFAYDEALNLRFEMAGALKDDKIIEPEHLLLALLREEEGVACRVLEKAGVNDFAALRVEIMQAMGVNQEDLIGDLQASLQVSRGEVSIANSLSKGYPFEAIDENSALPQYSGHARELIAVAQEAASNHGHDVMGSGHLLLAALTMHKGLLLRAMSRCGVERYQVDEELSNILGPGSGVAASRADSDAGSVINVSPACAKLLQRSAVEALEWHHGFIGVEHILLVLLREHEGVAGRILDDFNVERAILRNRIMADQQFGKLDPALS